LSLLTAWLLVGVGIALIRTIMLGISTGTIP